MKQIVIAQRGWVFVGDVTRSENEVVIENAAVVRRWGTTRGPDVYPVSVVRPQRALVV